MPDVNRTRNWTVEGAPDCSCCGAPLEHEIAIVLGTSPAHRMTLGTAEGLANAILDVVNRKRNSVGPPPPPAPGPPEPPRPPRHRPVD